MKERPILFSAPMVRALLDGSKTQTRRAIKPQPDTRPGMNCTRLVFKDRKGQPLLDEALEAREPRLCVSLCPYGQPGDRLWVRETTHRRPMLNIIITGEPLDPIYDGGAFSVDGEDVLTPEGFDINWWYSRKTCPAIHMPRWASRILLEITDVRVERLQDISEADALAEGIVRQRDDGFGLADTTHYHAADPRMSYWSLWEAINGPESVEVNPWIWAVSFKRVTPS